MHRKTGLIPISYFFPVKSFVSAIIAEPDEMSLSAAIYLGLLRL